MRSAKAGLSKVHAETKRIANLKILATFMPLLLLVTSCAQEGSPAKRETEPPVTLGPTRGYVLISIDTLRADHLSCYGYHRSTSPFMDSLAARGFLFERMYAQYPATLVSHMSLFTGLYPREHGVYPPSAVLSVEVETLPERLLAAGFQTAGHTEGGFVAGDYGFSRGFSEFSDTPYRTDQDIERTFDRGVEFLRRLGDRERFFLFLHTYSVHDPYDPPEPYRSMFAQESDLTNQSSHGSELRRFNRREIRIAAETIESFEALYDGSIRYADHVLSNFFESLAELGLSDETTVLITSDHGEEFLEHGKLAHEQLYTENLHVPLILVHPRQDTGIRISNIVQGIDVAATIYDLAGIELPERYSGKSLVPLLESSESAASGRAYGELSDRTKEQTLIEEVAGRTLQLLVTRPTSDGAGMWITREVSFDTDQSQVEFEAVSFHRPRRIQVTVDGVEQSDLVLPTSRIQVHLNLPSSGSVHRIELRTDGCDSPSSLGLGDDTRCLSFEVRGLTFQRIELYDLDRDPAASIDIFNERPNERREMMQRLTALRWSPAAQSSVEELTRETESALRALGYLTD